MNGLQSLPQWKSYFNHPTASQLGAINAMYPVGQFLGTLPATWLSDRYGRKVPIYVGFGLIFLSAGLSAGARDLAMLIVARLLVGMGSSFIALPSPVLIAELAYPTHRGKLAAFYYTNYVSIARAMKHAPGSTSDNIIVVHWFHLCCMVDIRHSDTYKQLVMEIARATSVFATFCSVLDLSSVRSSITKVRYSSSPPAIAL